MHCKILPAAAALLALLAGAAPMRAQIVGQPPAARECRLWSRQIAAGGAPAMLALTQGNLAACPAGANTLAAALRRAGAQRDTAYLYALTCVAAFLRDSLIFEAAIDLAAQRTATTPARAAGILVLVSQAGASWMYPGVSGSNLLSDTLPAQGFCGPGVGLTDSHLDGRALPSDYQRRIAQVFDAIELGRAPRLLQNLVHCSRAVAGDAGRGGQVR